MKKFGKFGLIAILVIFVAVVILSGSIWERNKAGYYQVKQVLWKGDLTLRDGPGIYYQGFSAIETYELAKEIYLSKDLKDGGSENSSERVLFPDGYADINFAGMYELSLNDDIQKALHIKYNTDEQVSYMVQQQIIEALKNTGTLMSAEEAYSHKRAEFVRLAREQALVGLYKSQVEVTTEEINGQVQTIKKYSVALDENGLPIITKESLLASFEILLPQYNIKDMDFDDKLEGLIEGRKDAQKSIQDAITERAKGEVRIATEKADQEVLKIKEVTVAQKNKEVAILDAQREKEVAVQIKLKAVELKAAKILDAEAKRAELEIADGLSDLAKYQIDADVREAIGTAEHMSKWIGPQFVINGSGNGKDGGSQIENVLMIKMMQDLVEKNK